MMIEGITVLNNIIISDFNPVPWLIVLIGLLLFAFIIIYIESNEIKEHVCVILCAMFALALILLIADIRLSRTDAIQCTIEDNVSINEVYDKYDVIDKQGEIWTLREKTEK